MKAYDTAWATQLALRHAGPAGAVVSAQNCWPDPIVARIAGATRAIGLVMSKIGVALWTPGRVERGVEKGEGAGHDVFRVGEHDGRVTPRVQELAQMLSVIDGARATDNLWGERWAKLSQNAMSNPLQALSGLGSVEVASSEVGRTLMIRLAAGSRARRPRARAPRARVRGGARRAVGRRRPPRDLGGARSYAHAGGRRRPQLARVDGPGRRQGPSDGDRRDERSRGGRGTADGHPDPGLGRHRGDRARDRSRRADAVAQNLELVLRRAAS